jgi:hypothetical protein
MLVRTCISALAADLPVHWAIAVVLEQPFPALQEMYDRLNVSGTFAPAAPHRRAFYA